MNASERVDAIKTMIQQMRERRFTYDEALHYATQAGSDYARAFTYLFLDAADWNKRLFALDMLEARWPQAAFESVRALPVPESIVRAR